MTKIRRVRSFDKAVGYLDTLDKMCFPSIEPYPKKGALWWEVTTRSFGSESVIGFAGLKLLDDGVAFLCRVGVAHEFRGRGLQKRLIRVREVAARKARAKWLITYVHPANLASANSLISCGMRLYRPTRPYGVDGALYFRKELI